MKEAWGQWCWAVFCDRADGFSDKTQPFFLRYLPQGRLCVDAWSPRNFATLPGNPTFSPRPTFEVGDARLGSVRLWREWHESSRSGATTGEDSEGSFGRERQGVPFFRGRHSRRERWSGHEYWDYGRSFLPHWSAASGWKLWASVPPPGALYSVYCPCQRGHVTRFWLVFTFAPYFLRGLCASSLLPVLVHYTKWDVSSDLVSLHQLETVTREPQPGVWGKRRRSAGVSSHLGHRHLPKSLCGNVGLPEQQSSWKNFSIASNSRCTGAYVSVVSISGGSTVLVEAFWKYVGWVFIFACSNAFWNGQLPDCSVVWTGLPLPNS